jgi:hypothetical protein
MPYKPRPKIKLKWRGSLKAEREREKKERERINLPPKKQPPKKLTKQQRKKRKKESRRIRNEIMKRVREGQKPISRNQWTTYQEYLKTDWWRSRRRRSLISSRYKCSKCGKKKQPPSPSQVLR